MGLKFLKSSNPLIKEVISPNNFKNFSNSLDIEDLIERRKRRIGNSIDVLSYATEKMLNMLQK